MRRKMKYRLWLLGVSLASVAGSARAVDPLPPSADPGALQQQRIEEETLRQLRERIDRKREANPVKSEEPQPARRTSEDAGPRILMTSVRFTPSEIFSEAELKDFAATLEGREVSFGDIEGLVARINDAYKAKGIVTAQATLMPQNVSDGTLEIRLVEGRLGAVRIAGNESTNADYITRRITLKPGQLVNLPTLEKDLRRFNRSNDVQLGAELKAGSSFGTSDLYLTAQEPPRHDLRLVLDNFGSESTGEWRAGLFYSNRSLTGHRDDLSLSTVQAEGQNSYSIGYGFPINTRGGRLSLAYFEDHTRVRNGPLRELDLTGESRSGIATLRQPLALFDGIQVDGLATFKNREYTNWISGLLLQETKTVDGSLGAEIWQVSPRGYWLASYSYTSGNTESDAGDDYQVGRGALRGSWGAPNGWVLSGNISFQHTRKDQLIAGEQMLIGGEGSVRGYKVGTYAGKAGYSASVEAHHPLYVPPRDAVSLPVSANGFAFIDYGRVSVYRPPASTLDAHESLSSVGVGVNASIGKRVSVSGTLAYAIDEATDEQRGMHVGIQITASLF